MAASYALASKERNRLMREYLVVARVVRDRLDFEIELKDSRLRSEQPADLYAFNIQEGWVRHNAVSLNTHYPETLLPIGMGQ